MSFRTAVSFFTGKDVVSVKNLLTELMSGFAVITCFTRASNGTLAKHSLIRDSGGDPMYESVRPGEGMETEKEKFREELRKNSDPELLKCVHHIKKEGGVEEQTYIDVREVSESLEEV